MSYCALLRDEYPPFSWEPDDYPLLLDIPRAERQSRFRLFIRAFAIVPNYLAFYVMQIAWQFTTFISWFAILITGRYPRGLFKFSVGVGRWYQRMAAYLYLLRDEYPPYSINADARPGNEVASAIIGVPLFFLLVAVQLLPFFGLLRTEQDDVVVRASITNGSEFRHEAPTGEANNTRITLLDYDDDGALPFGSRKVRRSGYRVVVFHVYAEQTGSFPTLFSPYFLRLHDCLDDGYSPTDTLGAESGFEVRLWWFDGDTEGDVYFEIPRIATPCDLIYHAGLGEVRFIFSGP